MVADGGLPEVASLQAGPFAALLHNDPPTLVTDGNTLTFEVPALPARSSVRLTLVGPHDQLLEVPLRPVQVLDGPSDEGVGGHAHPPAATSHVMPEGSVMPSTAHDMAGLGHEMAGLPSMAHAMPAQPTPASQPYVGRGSVSLPEPGRLASPPDHR